MFIIKQNPKDFRVDEQMSLDLHRSGEYTYFLLKKINWTTSAAIEVIAKKLRLPLKYFNVAGLKDKNAITTQYVSCYKLLKDKLEALNIKGIEVKYLGKGDERIKLGQLTSNKFVITVRNIEKKYEPVSFIENYYDDQRFSGKNHFIGKALARNEWSKAAAILRLKAEGSDFIGALRNGVTRKMLVFYLNAYQSYLWNEVVRLYLLNKYEYKWDISYQAGNFVFSNEPIMNKIVPILGYLTQLRDPTIKNVYEELMVKEGITQEAFKFIPMPEIRSEGNERDMIVRLPDLKLSYLKDSKNYSCKLSFTLPPGSYATMVVKKMFCDRNL